MIRLLRTKSQGGFTVIEVMAALVVFSLLTLGLTPLLLSSIKGSALSQSYTVGKNFALESMERVRGLPYYVGFLTQPDGRPVDVLDLYYPSYVASGTYATVCTSATTAVPACPKKVPDGYSVTFEATFVEPDGDITAETYSMVLPPTTYRWDSDSADLPASQILEFRVTVEWLRGGETKSSRLRTLISDRKFGDVKLRGDAVIDYGIEVQTGYVDPAGASSVLTATSGKAESLIESKTLTTSNQTARSTELRLTEVPADASAIGADIDFLEGAKGVYHAPPNVSPADTSLAAQSLTHPNLDPQAIVASFETTAAKNLDVGVINELPFANGEFAVGDPDPGSSSDDLWVAPQVSTEDATDLLLNTSRPMFFMRHSGSDVMTGGSDAVATALNSMDRKVLATGEVSFRNLRLLPTTFVSSSETEGAVVVVDEFTASVSCKSTADAGTADTSAVWNATLRYWHDPTDDGVLNGSYATVMLSGAAVSDALADVRAAGNPLVYDGAPGEDVYLFDDSAAGQIGYLSDWGSLFSASTTGVTEDAAGHVTTAGIDGAVSIKTAAHGTTPESGLSVNLGKLNCEAVDRR